MAADPRDSFAYRQALVEILRRDGHLQSTRIAAAFLAVPREVFVPGLPLDEVYSPSDAIVVKRLEGLSVSSASAPEVIALMLEQLDPRPGDRILEIGAGTGYNAALLAHIVGERGQVVTLDIDEDLVVSARQHLLEAGFSQVSVVQADGALGYPQAQPYDRLILTVASGDIAPAWWDQLSRDEGRLVLPLALRGLQRCVALTAALDREFLLGRSPRSCSFISLRGQLAPGPLAPRWRVESDVGCVLNSDDERPGLPPDLLTQLLLRPMRYLPTGVSASLEELRQGLQLWLVAHDPDVYTLWSASGLPDLFGLGGRAGARGTLCLVDAELGGLALLAWSDESLLGGELCVLAPSGCDSLADSLAGQVRAWVAAGRPLDDELEIRAYPRGSAPSVGEGEVAIDQHWTRFVLAWQPPVRLV